MKKQTVIIAIVFGTSLFCGFVGYQLGVVAESQDKSINRDWVVAYPKGLSATVDAKEPGRIAAIRREVSSWPSSANLLTRAKAYIGVRYVLGDVDWRRVMAITKKAVESDPVVQDVPSYAQEMAFISLLLTDKDAVAWSNVAFSFRKVSSGRRFLLDEYCFARDWMDDKNPPAQMIGMIAATYSDKIKLKNLGAFLNGMGGKSGKK